MSRQRPDPSTGEGWRTIHVRPATYERLRQRKSRGASLDAVVGQALDALEVHNPPPAGWTAVHVRRQTADRLERLRGRSRDVDWLIGEAITARAVYFHPSTPGSYRVRGSTYFERLAPTPEFGVVEAQLCEAGEWTRLSRNAPLACSVCGEPKYQTQEEALL